MVCQKLSYFDALSLDISGGGEAVSSDLCDSSNVTVLGFLSGPIPMSSTVASPKAISSSPEFCFVWLPSMSKILFPTFSPLGSNEIWEVGEKELRLSHTDTPIDVFVLLSLPFSSWVVQILNQPNTSSHLRKIQGIFLPQPIGPLFYGIIIVSIFI